MATITTATTQDDRLQPDGTRFVTFVYTFDTGETHRYGPLFPPDGTDLAALRTSIGNHLLELYALAEIRQELANG